MRLRGYARILSEPLWLGTERVFSISEEHSSGVDWDPFLSTHLLSLSSKYILFSTVLSLSSLNFGL